MAKKSIKILAILALGLYAFVYENANYGNANNIGAKDSSGFVVSQERQGICVPHRSGAIFVRPKGVSHGKASRIYQNNAADQGKINRGNNVRNGKKRIQKNIAGSFEKPNGRMEPGLFGGRSQIMDGIGRVYGRSLNGKKNRS